MKKMRNIKLSGILFVFVFYLSLFSSDEKWWNENWEYRVKITLKNPYEVPFKNIPIIISGEILRRKTGLLKEKISTSSIRIVDLNGVEIPVQVDEKDEIGLFQNIGNGELDKGDEIVFQVSFLPKEEKNLYIYFRKKIAPLPEYPTDLKFTKTVFGQMGINYNGELKNSIISIGIRGSGKEKDEKGNLIYGGLGKGAITSFKIKDKELIYQGHSWGWYLLYSQISTILPWEDPILLIDGPVRKIVVCKALNQDRNFTEELKGSSWMLSGKI
ncbi:MAG: hypothetical protein NC833_05380, partial [Candidatus Omnitrophica bacterium]|nr:hypothetical protein [Candidatus Omnitrophota bacterium]